LIVAPDQALHGACCAGEHTVAILQELGYNAAEVESFITAT
jgi:hypothetical protein